MEQTFLQKVLSLFKSRKFWVLVIAIVTGASLFSTGQITSWEFIQALVAALAAYSTGVAIEDAGARIGTGNTFKQ